MHNRCQSDAVLEAISQTSPEVIRQRQIKITQEIKKKEKMKEKLLPYQIANLPKDFDQISPFMVMEKIREASPSPEERQKKQIYKRHQQVSHRNFMKLNKELKEMEYAKKLMLKRKESNSSFRKLTSIQLPSIHAYENQTNNHANPFSFMRERSQSQIGCQNQTLNHQSRPQFQRKDEFMIFQENSLESTMNHKDSFGGSIAVGDADRASDEKERSLSRIKLKPLTRNVYDNLSQSEIKKDSFTHRTLNQSAILPNQSSSLLQTSRNPSLSKDESFLAKKESLKYIIKACQNENKRIVKDKKVFEDIKERVADFYQNYAEFVDFKTLHKDARDLNLPFYDPANSPDRKFLRKLRPKLQEALLKLKEDKREEKETLKEKLLKGIKRILKNMDAALAVKREDPEPFADLSIEDSALNLNSETQKEIDKQSLSQHSQENSLINIEIQNSQPTQRKKRVIFKPSKEKILNQKIEKVIKAYKDKEKVEKVRENMRLQSQSYKLSQRKIDNIKNLFFEKIQKQEGESVGKPRNGLEQPYSVTERLLQSEFKQGVDKVNYTATKQYEAACRLEYTQRHLDVKMRSFMRKSVRDQRAYEMREMLNERLKEQQRKQMQGYERKAGGKQKVSNKVV